MKKIIKIFLIFIIIFITVDIICDVLAPAFYYIKFSSNYEYMIVMIPSDTKDIKKRHIGRGIVFEMYPKVYEMFDERTYDTFGIFSNKTALKLYEVDWYSMLVDISNDGNILVRYGPWSPDSKEFYEEELIIIAIYEKGKLLKQYTARELMLNDKSPRFISSYEIPASKAMVKPGFSEDGLTYTVVFQDKTVCIFSVKSGDVIKKYSLDK